MESYSPSEQGLIQTSAPDLRGVLYQLVDGSVQSCNAAAEQILGLTSAHLQTWNAVGFPGQVIDVEGMPCPLEAQPAQITARLGQSCFGVVLGLHTLEGRCIWIQVDTEPLFRASETVPYAVISTFIEIPTPGDSPALTSPITRPHIPTSVTQPLETILENMTDAFVAVDRDWRIIYVNQAAARMICASADALIGRSHWNVWSALLGTVCEENYERAIAEQRPVHFEYFYEPRQRWYEIHAYPSPAGLSIYYHDIDEPKRADAALQDKNEQLRLALDFAQIGSWDWNLKTNQVKWNEIHFLLLGLDPNTATADYETWRSRIHPDDVERVESLLHSALEVQTTFEAEYRVYRPDGSIRWLSDRGQGVYDPSGQLIRMIGVLMDITERKQTEANLQQFKDIFQFTEHGLAIGKEGKIELVNPAFARMHGYTADEMVGKPVLDLFPSEDRADFARFLQQVEQAGHLTRRSIHVRQDGSQFPILLDITAVKDTQEDVLYRIVTAMDMTEQERLEQGRQQAEIVVHRLNQRLLQLVQVIQKLAAARDLPTIMAAIRSTARQLVGADGSTFVLREGDFSFYADEEAIAPLWRGQRFPLDACVGGWVMLNRAPAVIPDVFADPRIPVEVYRATFVKSLVMLPIHTIAPIGAIGVYWATDYSPTPEEVNLLQTLADAAAIAIQNVHLYEGLEQRVQERTAQLQQSLDFEALLKRITDHVRDSLDEDQILQTVVTELGQGLGLQCCDTGIYNADRTMSTIVCEFNPSLGSAEGKTFAIPSAAYPEIYQCLFQGEIAQFCTRVPNTVRSDQQLLSILACPIHDDQDVLGDLWLFKPASAVFNEQETRLVQQVANQCAIALRQSRLYQAAQSQVIALEQLNQLKDDFLSTVSHELRSPMANIKMAARMLSVALKIPQQSTPSVAGEITLSSAQTEKVIQYLEILNQECQRETHLIDDLLDLARLDARTTLLTPTEINLHEWLPRVAQSFTERISQQQQQLQIKVPSDLPPLITDSTSLERIVGELIHNACKYTLPAETIRITATVQSSHIAISVSNSGVEIPADVRDRIFDKFYRIPSHDPWKHGGTGLGLALVKKLVELLQGEISVVSENNWTQFTVYLPQKLLPQTDISIQNG